MRIKILDKYIIRKFLGTYIYSIVLLSFIIIVFDISEKIDDFTAEKSKDATLNMIVFDYYLNFIPYFVNQFNAMFVFIAVIFFTSKMAVRTEIVAILTSGVGFYRLLRPYMITATGIMIVNMLMTFWVIPESNEIRIDFENKYINHIHRFDERNIHVQLDKDSYAYFQSFNVDRNTGYQFSLEHFEGEELVYKLMATFAKWDSTDHHWIIEDYKIRTIQGIEENISSGKRMDTVLNITPKDFKEWLNNVETMNYTELNTFIEKERAKGSKLVNFYLVEKYKRVAFPVASIILTIIGFSIASRKIRGGVGMHLGLGTLLCFTYILFSQIFFVYSTQGNMPPLLGVWIPNILYSGIAGYLVFKAQK